MADTPRSPRSSPWFTPAEAAEYLGVAVGTLRNWTSARYVPFARRGRVVRYRREELDEWLARGGCKGRTTLADQHASQQPLEDRRKSKANK